MKELLGKTITGLRVRDGEDILVFDHPDGTWTAYATHGDCCSETWFADIVGVNALINATVLEVQDVELEDDADERTRQEYDRFYGVKLKTDRGYVDIVYRNSSNGYYGGDISLYRSDSLPVGNFTTIADDWSA